MCGIFGWHLPEGQLSNTKRKQLYDLLTAQNDQRGGHSWGVCVVDRLNSTPSVERGLGNMFDARYEGALPWKSDVMFGHTRMATHGARTVGNAHPFEIGSVIGAHNGVLSNHFQLNQENNRAFEVDSQHIFAHIDEGKNLKDIEGYGAIEYIRKDNPTEVFIGTFNHYVSIWRILEGKTSAGIVWTSDDKHGKFALKMLRLDVEELKVHDNHLYSIRDADSYETNLKLKCRKAASKVSWREGWNENGANANTFRGHNFRTVQSYTPYPDASRLLTEGEAASQEGSKSDADSCGRRTGRVARNLLPAITADDVDMYFCKHCHERNEDCCCNEGTAHRAAVMAEAMSDENPQFIECPDCEDGWVERNDIRGFFDYVRCSTCIGQGMIPDPAFHVEDGFNDRIKSC